MKSILTSLLLLLTTLTFSQTQKELDILKYINTTRQCNNLDTFEFNNIYYHYLSSFTNTLYPKDTTQYEVNKILNQINQYTDNVYTMETTHIDYGAAIMKPYKYLKLLNIIESSVNDPIISLNLLETSIIVKEMEFTVQNKTIILIYLITLTKY